MDNRQIAQAIHFTQSAQPLVTNSPVQLGTPSRIPAILGDNAGMAGIIVVIERRSTELLITGRSQTNAPRIRFLTPKAHSAFVFSESR